MMSSNWSYDDGDPSVGIFRGEWIHEVCPVDDPDEGVDEQAIAKIDLGQGVAQYWIMLTCRDCAAQELVNYQDYDYVDDPSYLAWEEEQEAINSGKAMRLVHCYLCYLEATGKSDCSSKQDLGPLRGVEREKLVGPEHDPYAMLCLVPCGHGLI